jgi:hypothetical protein
MTMRLTGTCVLVLGVFAFAVPAYAGNENGNGNGNGNGKGNAGASDVAPAPGNSANAPGQQKQDAAPPVETTTTAVVTTTDAAPASEGGKPSNNTEHETHAQAQSKQTKLYGNGQTAGQIAMKHGASGSTVLHGPGNSQPHKAAPCSGGHERDVHALKGRHAPSCGGNTPTPQPTRTPSDPPGHHDTSPALVTTAVDPAPQPGSTGGEAPGAVASWSSDEGSPQGVLARGRQIGRAASLPFTGLGLWPALLVGMALIAAGLALRQIRMAEVAVGSGHDHTNRARDASGSSRPSVGGRTGR